MGFIKCCWFFLHLLRSELNCRKLKESQSVQYPTVIPIPTQTYLPHTLCTPRKVELKAKEHHTIPLAKTFLSLIHNRVMAAHIDKYWFKVSIQSLSHHRSICSYFCDLLPDLSHSFAIHRTGWLGECASKSGFQMVVVLYYSLALGNIACLVCIHPSAWTVH